VDPFAARTSLSIVQALRGRTVLLTGATGFLGKIILEKILRSAPDVARVYVLVRPRKGSTADERMQSEIIQSEVRGTDRHRQAMRRERTNEQTSKRGTDEQASRCGGFWVPVARS
jgi:FlaA1/EpsC-like NDP-sugar epimerase